MKNIKIIIVLSSVVSALYPLKLIDFKNAFYSKTQNVLFGSKKRTAAALLGAAYLGWRYLPSMAPYLCGYSGVEGVFGYHPDEQKRLNNMAKDKKHYVLGMHGFGNRAYAFCKSDAFDNGKLIECNHTIDGIPGKGFFDFLVKVRSTSLAQGYDALSHFYQLIKLKEANQNLESVSIVGESYGGGTAVTFLSMLSEPSNYDYYWKLLSKATGETIDLNYVKELKKLVQKGSVVLGAPWLDENYGISHFAPGFLKWGAKLGLHLFTNYSFLRGCPAYYLEKLIKKNEFDVTVNFCKSDSDVGNRYDELFLTLAQNNDHKDKFKCLQTMRGHVDRKRLDEMLPSKVKKNVLSILEEE